MKCEAARDLLLEASRAELRGEGESPVALHIAECSACRGLARGFLKAEEDLDRGLDALVGTRSGEEILAAVRRDTGRRQVGGTPVADEAPVIKPRFREVWRIGTPLAAAAVLAVVLLVRGDPEAASAPENTPYTAVEVSQSPPVEVEADRRFALMKTGDPKIHVVWFY